MRVAFLDRDGTLVAERPDDEWSSTDRLELVPGAIHGLKDLQSLGYTLILVTNQYLIGEGHLSQRKYDELAGTLRDALNKHHVELLEVFYCPHARGDGCDCMKPRPGLVTQAIEKYPSIEVPNSIVIGDSDCDMELAIHFAMKGFALPGSAQEVMHPRITNVTSLAAVAQQLTDRQDTDK